MKDDALTGQLTRFLTLRRDLVLTIGIGVVSLIVVAFLIVAQINAILTLRGQIQQAQQEKVQLQRKNQLLQEANANPLLAQETAINAALEDSKPLTQLLSALSSVAGEAQVSVRKVNLTPGLISTESAQTKTAAPVSSSSIPGVDIMKIEITVGGSFLQINDFLTRLDRMSPLVIVNVFNLSESSIATDTSGFEATITLDTYFYTNSVTATLTQELPEVNQQNLQTLQQISTYTRSNTALPTQVVGGGVEDLFGLSQSELEEALQSQAPAATTAPTVEPVNPTP